MFTRPKTLIINRSDSQCGDCGRSADPNETAHTTLLGYGPDNGKPGCGSKWEKVTSDYGDFAGLYDSIKKMRPDLKFVDSWADVHSNLGHTHEGR